MTPSLCIMHASQVWCCDPSGLLVSNNGGSHSQYPLCGTLWGFNIRETKMEYRIIDKGNFWFYNYIQGTHSQSQENNSTRLAKGKPGQALTQQCKKDGQVMGCFTELGANTCITCGLAISELCSCAGLDDRTVSVFPICLFVGSDRWKEVVPAPRRTGP